MFVYNLYLSLLSNFFGDKPEFPGLDVGINYFFNVFYKYKTLKNIYMYNVLGGQNYG